MSLASFVSSFFSTIHADAPAEEPTKEEESKEEETPETEDSTEEASAEEEEEEEPEDVRVISFLLVYCAEALSDSPQHPGGVSTEREVCSCYEALLALPGKSPSRRGLQGRGLRGRTVSLGIFTILEHAH